MDDFDPVAGREWLRFILAANHDVFIELQRNAPAGQVELRKQIGNGGAGSELVGFTVKDDFHTNILAKFHGASLRMLLKVS